MHTWPFTNSVLQKRSKLKNKIAIELEKHYNEYKNVLYLIPYVFLVKESYQLLKTLILAFGFLVRSNV